MVTLTPDTVTSRSMYNPPMALWRVIHTHLVAPCLLLHHQQVCNNYHKQLPFCSDIPLATIIPPLPVPQHSSELSDINCYIQPHVLLWNPLQQFPNIHITCIRDHCSLFPLSVKYWRIGQTQSLQPRVIHTTDYIVLLVSPVYKCPVGHEVSSTDPKIIDLLGEHNVPFILFHKTGLMKNFEESVIEFVKQGMSLRSIECFIQQMRLRFTASLTVQLHTTLQSKYGVGCPANLLDLIETSHALRLIREPFPSNDILSKCFIVDYLRNKDVYSHHMSNLPVRTYISFDHTFKIAANIGYVRSDGKWVTLYKSVFIVLNEIGQVLAWQFTSSTAIDEVTPLLKNLHNRLKDTWLPPRTVFVDNCCQQRQRMRTIFGPDTLVKLDVFHAIQRITTQLPKRHPFFLQCKNDLKFVIRSPTDLGEERKESTPAPAVILNSLDTFHKKWVDCDSNGWKLINPKSVKEISALKVHINKGCLSYIAPGCGTNRNEALHRHINPHFTNKTRIGLPLAIALLAILLYQHNCRIEEKITHTPPTPIALWKHKHRDNQTVVSTTLSKGKSKEQKGWFCSSVADLSNVIFSPSCLQDETVNVNLSEQSVELITLADVLAILENAINLAKVALTMHKVLKGSPIFDYRMLPLCSSVASIFFDQQHNELDTHAENVKRLDNIIRAWGMQRFRMEGDGNCCFYSVAFAILSNANQIGAHTSDFFDTHKLDLHRNLIEFAHQLRNLAVEEWKSNPQDYEGFVPGVDVTMEAEKFKESGVFLGELGNTVVLNLSNVLGIPIIVLSSAINHPLINITPRHMTVPIPLYIAYNQYGVGHYDAIITSNNSQLPTSSTSAASTEVAHCTCGKNDKSSQTRCKPQEMKYTSVIRCPCCKNETACTVLCKCKNCKNPFGCQPEIEEAGVARKRPRHMWQHNVQKSSIFATEVMKTVPTGPRSILEFFVLECTLKYCLREGIDTTTRNIEIVYNTAAELADTLEDKLPLSTKTEGDIERFLREHDHILRVYKEICFSQVRAQNP